uniref:F-box associated domain-containing protein n=1 Tax=Setaria viridis TaxID=4556 RepID=A0A4U6TRV3_SETVI|nr:hypothetical protein SEVIR_7G022900v2 [Setaria viridis]
MEALARKRVQSGLSDFTNEVNLEVKKRKERKTILLPSALLIVPQAEGSIAAHLHGNLHVHWKKQCIVHYHRILVFDTVAELFRQMRPPAVNPRDIMRLFDMDGMLAASCSKDAMMGMRIFALQDYKIEIWSFQYRIKLPEMEIRQFQEQGDWFAKIVSEGDLLVICFGWLLHCDRMGNLLAKFQYDDDLPVLIPYRLKESLIQHTFFQKKQNKTPSSFMPC